MAQSNQDAGTKIEEIVKEYFSSLADEEAVAKSVSTIAAEEYPRFVKKSIFMALDRQAYERELISKLLASTPIYNTITRASIQNGFKQALDNLDDVTLDNPDAPEVLAKFLARAVVDEILAPAFLTNVSIRSKLAQTSVDLAIGLSTESHVGEKLKHIWGPGDLLSVKRLKQEIKLLLAEYIINEDDSEADKSVRKLNAPSFHYQIVKIALRMGVEKNEEQRQKLLALIKHLYQVALLSETHIQQGFTQTIEMVDDLKLDVPSAASILSKLVADAKSAKILPETFTPSVSL
eukprot:TRINITY_DN4774_c0_g1_i1.p1 TRINITY_DN4774_c0_g1~~TRINITY_DN4774_c0_g1_i1.p1  ORF type:complete len:291 (+),score=136.74 TRINITY_DN4774_c0_g1_i1:143-1015(+)